MGASNFAYVIEGPTLKEAWDAEFRRQRDYNGSDPYSGTVASKNGLVQLVEVDDRADARVGRQGPLSDEEAHIYAERLMDDRPEGFWNDKWGTTAALALSDPAQFVWRDKTATLDLEVAMRGLRHFSQPLLVELAARQVRTAKGERVAAVKIESDIVKGRGDVKTQEGKALTRYYVRSQGGNAIQRPFPTVAAARKALTELLNVKAGRGEGVGEQYWIDGTVQRYSNEEDVTGHPLIRGSVSIRSRKLEVTAKLVKSKPGRWPQTRWLIFGWAPS